APTWRRCSDRQERLEPRGRGAGPSPESRARDAAAVPGAAPVLRDGALPLPAVDHATPRTLRPQGGADAARVGGAGCAATKDLDFLGRLDNSLENLEGVVREICTANVEPDGMEFDLATLRRP